MTTESSEIKEAAMAHLAKPEVIEAANMIQQIIECYPAGHRIEEVAVELIANNVQKIHAPEVTAYLDHQDDLARKILGVGRV